jgi:hypothetical protein
MQLLVLYEISKESLPKKPTKNIADKKIWFSNRQSFFEEVAQDMGLIPNKSGLDMGFERHPLRISLRLPMIFVTPSSILKMVST